MKNNNYIWPALGVLLLALPALATQVSKSTFQTGLTTTINDNSSGDITPSDVRSVFTDLSDSVYFLGDGTTGIDVLSGGMSLKIGADSAAATRTDTTTKHARIGAAHYTNAEEPMGMLYAQATSTNNDLRIGGGTNTQNAATIVGIYTAANTSTVTGTLRWFWTSSGNYNPFADNAYDNGSPSLRIKTVYAYTVNAATGVQMTATTVGALGTPTAGLMKVVSDAASATDCTSGGGSTYNVCMGNGSAWSDL